MKFDETTTAGPLDYFRELLEELDHGGRAAMMYDLLNVEVYDEWLRVPPESHAKVATTGITSNAINGNFIGQMNGGVHETELWSTQKGSTVFWFLSWQVPTLVRVGTWNHLDRSRA